MDLVPHTPSIERCALKSVPISADLPSKRKKPSVPATTAVPAGPKVKNSLLLESGRETIAGGGTRIVSIDRTPRREKRRKQTRLSLIRVHYLNQDDYNKRVRKNALVL